MMVYKSKRRASLKWILGVIVFILGMTFTLSDVSGFGFPKSNHEGYTNGQGSNGEHGSSTWQSQVKFDGCERSEGCPPPPPPQVPEPGTLVLLGTGLIGLYAMRQKNGK